MKNLLVLITFISLATSANAQLTRTVSCPPFVIDILDGNVNKSLSPKSTLGEIQKIFPCHSSVVEKGTDATCAGLFYQAEGISFYTDRNYIEITSGFKGKLSLPLMGSVRGSLFTTLGNPKIKDVNWDAYQTEYGTVILYYKGNRVNKIQLSTKNTDTIKLCE